MSEEGTIDADYLFRLAREKSRESRASLTQVIMDLFEEQRGALTDRERSLMYGILQSVVREIEMSVRKAVASRLAHMPDVPRDLLSQLSNDEIEVAFPILTECGLLRDEDLIDVIRLRTMEHQLAVAMRHDISEAVSEALVETGQESVIVTLLKNNDARISSNTMEYLVQQSQRLDAFQDPILHRQDLKPDLAKRMFMWVSAALRQHVIDNFELDKQTVDDLLEQVAIEELESGPRETTTGRAEELARILKEEGLVTVDMLITALREGEVPLFVSMFCKMTELREYLIMRLLFEQGGEGLAIACRGIGIGKAEFSELFILSRKAKAQDAKEIREALPPVLDFYDAMTGRAAAEVLRMWRRGSDYLGAIRQLQINMHKDG